MEYRSADPDLDLPSGRLDEYLLEVTARFDPGRVAVLDRSTGRSVTYGDLPGEVSRLAGALQRWGISPSDVVAVHLPNGVEYAVLALALSRCGAAMTPVSIVGTAEEISRQLTATAAVAVVTDVRVAAVGVAAAEAAGLALSRVVMVGDDLSAAGDCSAEVTSWTSLAGGDGPDDVAGDVPVDPAAAAACLPMSSGTTGLPKPVWLTHRALTANVVQFASALDWPAEQTTLAFLPFSHVYAMSTVLFGGLARGDTIVTMPRFHVADAVDVVEQEQVTMAFIVPPVATILAAHPSADPDRLHSLQLVISGAAPLDPAVARAIAVRLGVDVLQGYGLTEMAPVTHVMRPGTRMPLDSVGTAVPGVVFRVVDPVSGVDVDPVEQGRTAPGELWVRGPNMMSGYVGAPEATAVIIDEDGWLHTGDMVTVDAAGCVTIVARLKELLKCHGYQVAPAELEALLREYPGVSDAAVVGVPVEDSTDERPYALVVRGVSAGSGPSEEGLLQYVADRTARYKHLAGVTFVDAVPRDPSGKMRRRDLSALVPVTSVPAR
ncbi:Long-chain-fatty-acid--CoA ligase [Austwickia sp. TVS 96-490-7B]|uniref:AMP-binding protein n=1 Tax=Austwickia sp. TVS 96-490-7B TaxID=2830843 RepID=UPI001C573F61|nr:AMP-binding protein [Austwickia sp. TVS 96-490-7B]MBW3085557.1 Long-chain-fatty-acid--CoA ligase [Austwickia sp. TVS 96-490-7B]